VRRSFFSATARTYAGGYVDAIDAYLRLHDPKNHYELINIGLPSETLAV